MTQKELKHLSRGELLQMLIEQVEENQELKSALSQAQTELKNRRIALDNAGSIAEAALQLNGVFSAAQNACEQYLKNIRLYCKQQKDAATRLVEESRAEAERLLAEARQECDRLRQEAACAQRGQEKAPPDQSPPRSQKRSVPRPSAQSGEDAELQEIYKLLFPSGDD